MYYYNYLYFVVVLFMVLKDDNINQAMLLPLNLKEIIPEDHPCFFIKNVVDLVDCSKSNQKFVGTPGEFAYPREILLRLVLMSVFDGGLSSREIERKTRTDISYMYLAGMEKPSYRTIARFKAEYNGLIDETFKIIIKIAKEENLIKIHHLSIDGTKIKSKASINKLTDENQIKIMKNYLNKSNELDMLEDEELGEKSGNSIPKSLSDKEQLEKSIKKIENSSNNNKNKNKLRSSSINLLKQAEKSSTNKKQILKKLNMLEKKLNESSKEVISINDPDSRIMLNKKGKWEWDYNAQIIVDDYKGIILTSYITQNPTDHKELIPSIEQLESNLDEIYSKIPSNFQLSADNGYSTDENISYLEEKHLDGYISTRKVSRKEKKYNLAENPFNKDNFKYNAELGTYICPMGEILYKRRDYTYKNKSRISYWTKQCKNCIVNKYCCSTSRFRIIQDYGNPAKIRMLRKMETKGAQETYKKRSKTVELPFAHIKHNMKLTEFTTTGLKRTNTEFKLYTIGYNLKRIYNELNKEKSNIKTNT